MYSVSSIVLQCRQIQKQNNSSSLIQIPNQNLEEVIEVIKMLNIDIFILQDVIKLAQNRSYYSTKDVTHFQICLLKEGFFCLHFLK